MAQIGDILEKERKRETDCDGMGIHLFQEGSFYRAYERSAWLCVKHGKRIGIHVLPQKTEQGRRLAQFC